jgi:hypothetical protein
VQKSVAAYYEAAMSLKRKAEFIDQSASGGEHPVAKCTILFADTGTVHRELQGKILDDRRQPVSIEAVQEYADECDADIVVRVQELTPGGPIITARSLGWQELTPGVASQSSGNWQARAAVKWKLTPEYCATTFKLRRSTPCSEEIDLIVVRIIKGKSNLPRVHFSNDQRKAVAFALFKELKDALRPTIVLGNPGFALSSIVRFFQEYKNETNFDIAAHTQLLLSRDQELLCLHTARCNQTVLQLRRPTPDRIFTIQISSEDTSSGGKHPAASAKDEHPCGVEDTSNGGQGALLTTRTQALLRFLSEASDGTETTEHLASFLLRPVQDTSSGGQHPAASASSHGTCALKPVDIAESVGRWDRALALIEKARSHVGVTFANRTLTESDLLKALDWLQKSCFEEHFMQNRELKENITWLEAYPGKYTKAQKKKIKDDRRGAFRVWKHSLLGNTALFHAILHHGLFNLDDMREFMLAFFECGPGAGKCGRNSDDAHLAASSRSKLETLRSEALEARKSLKRAKQLANEVEHWTKETGSTIALSEQLYEAIDERGPALTREETKLLQELDSGKLEARCLEKNRAYGHGAGVESIPRHEAILFRVSCNRLDRHFNRPQILW